MLKACVSYSKKVPVDGLDFSSQGYSLTLETEIPESNPAAIQAKLHDTFEMVKTQVETELSNGSPKAASQPADNGGGAKPAGATPQANASNKQIKFITDLASLINCRAAARRYPPLGLPAAGQPAGSPIPRAPRAVVPSYK